MNKQEVFERYIQLCVKNLDNNARVRTLLRKQGFTEPFLFDSFRLGYSSKSLIELNQGNDDLYSYCDNLGLLNKGKEALAGSVTIPILGENKEVVNIAGYKIHPQSKQRLRFLNQEGLFNHTFLKYTKELILTESPLEGLLLIQNDIPNTTFVFGDDQKYLHFIQSHSIRKVIFTFEGRSRLYYELSKNGVSTRRVSLDLDELSGINTKEYLENVFAGTKEAEPGSDTIQEIEGGFLFRLPHLSYRIIENFSEYSLTMKANIKAFTEEEVFVDSIDLFKTVISRTSSTTLWTASVSGTRSNWNRTCTRS